MTFGPQWEYKETNYNLSLYLQDPENEVRQLVDGFIADAGSGTPAVIDGGTP